MNASNLPAANSSSLDLLLRLLRDRNVAVRVRAGEIQFSDPNRRLHAVDKAGLLHYEADLVAYLTRGACPHCGTILHDDRVVYRTDDRDRLQERCLACACTWLWGNTADIVLAAGSRPDERDDDGREAP